MVDCDHVEYCKFFEPRSDNACYYYSWCDIDEVCMLDDLDWNKCKNGCFPTKEEMINGTLTTSKWTKE